MRKAWIENGAIRDICHGNPNELYHPDVAKFYTADVPDDAANGDGWDGTTLTKPVIPEPAPVEPPAPVPPKVSPVEFMLLFTSPERIAIKAARQTDPVIDDWLDIVQDPRLTHVDLGLKSTHDALDYLTAQGMLDAGRKDEIIANTPQ